MKHPTIGKMVLKRVAESGGEPAIRHKKNGTWTDISWNELGARMERIAAGMLSPTQSGVNTNLKEHAVGGNEIAAALIQFLVGTSFALLIALLHRRNFAGTSLRTAPWYAFSGGLLGPIYVVTAVVCAPRLGFATFQLCSVLGSATFSLGCDAVGFLGLMKRTPTPWRVGCIALLAVGTGLSVNPELPGPWWSMLAECVVTFVVGAVATLQALIA